MVDIYSSQEVVWTPMEAGAQKALAGCLLNQLGDFVQSAHVKINKLHSFSIAKYIKDLIHWASSFNFVDNIIEL